MLRDVLEFVLRNRDRHRRGGARVLSAAGAAGTKSKLVLQPFPSRWLGGVLTESATLVGRCFGSEKCSVDKWFSARKLKYDNKYGPAGVRGLLA